LNRLQPNRVVDNDHLETRPHHYAEADDQNLSDDHDDNDDNDRSGVHHVEGGRERNLPEL
jgi:hypothetical protein